MNKREYAIKLSIWLTFILVIALVLPGCGSRHDDAEMWRDEAATNYAILHGHDYPSVDDYEAVDKAAGRKEDEDIIFHWREYKDIRDQIAEMIDAGTGTTAAEPSAEPSSTVAQDNGSNFKVEDFSGEWRTVRGRKDGKAEYIIEISGSIIYLTEYDIYYHDTTDKTEIQTKKYTCSYTYDDGILSLYENELLWDSDTDKEPPSSRTLDGKLHCVFKMEDHNTLYWGTKSITKTSLKLLRMK